MTKKINKIMARKCKIASFFSGSRGIDQIKEIGECMVECTSAQDGGPCAGIVTCQNKSTDGDIIPPRCLYLDKFRANEKFDDKLIYRIRKYNQEYYLQHEDSNGSEDIKLKKEDDGSFQLVENNLNENGIQKCFIHSKNENNLVTGIIVIGKNPGKIDDSELDVFTKLIGSDKSSESFYKGIVEFWKNNWFHGVHVIPFYNNINWLLNYLNFSVSTLDLQEVIWTEIIKCQFASEMNTSEFEFKMSYFVYWLNEDGKDQFRINLKKDDCINGELKIVYEDKDELCKINKVLKNWRSLMIKEDKIDSKLIRALYEKPGESESFIKINFKKYFDEVLSLELEDLPQDIKNHIVTNAFDWNNYSFNLTRGLDKNKFNNFKKLIVGLEEKYNNITEFKKYLNLNYLPKLEKYFKELTLFRNQNDSNQAYKDTSEYYPSSNECHRKYLKEELAISAVKDWPIICIGKDEFKFISFAYPDRIVIGLPHVTGAHGDAPKIYDYTKKDDQFENVRKSIVQWLDWRLSRRNTVELEKGNYTVPNARYFDLSSKFYELPKN